MQHCFAISYRRENQRQYELRALSETDCKNWIEAIREARYVCDIFLRLFTVRIISTRYLFPNKSSLVNGRYYFVFALLTSLETLQPQPQPQPNELNTYGRTFLHVIQ